MKFKSASSNQITLLPPTLDDFVPQNALARVVAEVVDHLNLASLYCRYSDDGCPAFHPKMMLRVLFFAYSLGIRGSRKIAQHLKQDTHFMFLSGMKTPDFRTISDFRKNNFDLLKEFFKQIVLYCVEIGMVNVGHISIDGTKIKASASKKQTRDNDRLQKEIEKLEKEISEIFSEAEKIDQAEDEKFGKEKSGDELPKEIQSKVNRLKKLEHAKELLEQQNWEKINLTDPDSRFMKSTSGKEVAYNAQIAADSDHQVIIANDVVTDTNDHHQFKPMYKQATKNVRKEPKETSADCGYANHNNYKYIRDNQIDAYIPPDQDVLKENSSEDPKSRYTKDKFQYDSERDVHICPEGRTLNYLCTTSNRGIQLRAYRCNDCTDCPVIDLCLDKSNKSKKRTIKIFETDAFVEQMRQKLKSDEGKEIYNKRLFTVEPPFGNIKYNLGFSQFSLRGHDKVRGEFNLMCIAHNLKKILNFKLALAV